MRRRAEHLRRPTAQDALGSAMMAKVGDAARASPSAAQSAPALRRVAKGRSIVFWRRFVATLKHGQEKFCLTG